MDTKRSVKGLSALLALLLSCLCAAPAFAANTTGGSTSITTEVAPAYTVTIPQKLEIPYRNTDAQPLLLAASGLLLETGKTVTVTAAGSGANGAFAMQNGESVLAYELSKKNAPWLAIASGGETAAFASDGETTIYAKVADWDVSVAGKYSGTITFTVSYQ